MKTPANNNNAARERLLLAAGWLFAAGLLLWSAYAWYQDVYHPSAERGAEISRAYKIRAQENKRIVILDNGQRYETSVMMIDEWLFGRGITIGTDNGAIRHAGGYTISRCDN